jgi:WD40 repeat protein
MTTSSNPQGSPNIVHWANPRRWFRLRFGLRTLMLVVTGVCIWLGLYLHRPPITSQNVSRLRVVDSRPWDVHQVVWNPNGTACALVSWEAPVDVHEFRTLLKLRTFGKDRKLIAFAFSPDEAHVAYCENNTTAILKSLADASEINIETGNAQPDLAFSPDGKWLATGGYGTKAAVWNVTNGALALVLDTGQVMGGLQPHYSPDGRWIAVGNRNSSTCIFSATTGQLVHRLNKASTQELMFSPDSSALAVTYVDGSVALYRVSDGSQIALQSSGAEELYALDWSRDGKMLVTAGSKGNITVWNGADLSRLRDLPAPPWVITVKFSPDGSRLITAGGSGEAGSTDRHLRVFAVGRFYEGWWE